MGEWGSAEYRAVGDESCRLGRQGRGKEREGKREKEKEGEGSAMCLIEQQAIYYVGL